MKRNVGFFFLGVVLSFAVAAAMYYDPQQPGHGIDLTQVGDKYTLTWYFHDGNHTRWIASDVCDYGDLCPVWTVAARSFPAVGAQLVEAGHVSVTQEGEGLRLAYDLHLDRKTCAHLPGPHPPECRNDDGTVNRDLALVYELDEAGSFDLELLAE